MKRIAKVMGVLFAIGVLVFGFASCKNANGGNDSTTDVIDDNVIYSPYVNTTLVLGEGVKERDVSAIQTAYYKKVGKEMSAGDSGSHKIIVGKTESPLSKKAYRYLDMIKAEGLVGYAIYSDGKSVAIAYDEAVYGENVAFIEAMERFVSKYMRFDTLKFNSGPVHIDTFDAIDKQAEREEASLERLWELKLSQISAHTYDDEEAKAILNGLKALYRMFNNNYSIVTWLANLYDPVSGGFYYSNSARNNEGYLPDLESTSQALGLIKSMLTGYGGTLDDYFGEEIANKFISFAKDMQQQDGYFYHPQWKDMAVNFTRKDMDVLAALNILIDFNASPTYDTPNGVKGEGVVSPVSKITAPLGLGKVKAVARLVSAESDEIYIPPYLKSKANFETYLSELNIKNDTEAACKTINSELSLYIAVDERLEEEAADYRLSEVLLKFLEKNQNSSTGLWHSSSEAVLKDISNLTEIAKIYDTFGECIPKYGYIIGTIEVYMKCETEENNISDIYEPWAALASLVNNITAYTEDKESVSSTLTSFYSVFAELLANTTKKLTSFLRNDGSFSTTPAGSASEQHGMPVAIPSSVEGDINATLIAAKNIWLSVFRVLCIGDVPIFNTSDRMMFQKTLLDMGVIIKNEIKEIEPNDFEKYNTGDTAEEVNLVKSGDDAERYAEIVDGPEKYGKVLKLYSSKEAGQDEFRFGIMSSVNGASCYSYEIDICVNPDFQEGMSSYLYLYKYLHMIGIERVGNTVRLLDCSSQWEAAYKRDIGIRAEVGEWFNLRVEYYPGTAETVRVKIFFNGDCVAVSDTYCGKESGEKPPTNYEGLAVFAKSKAEMSLLLDNLVTSSSYKTYTPEKSSDLNINVDNVDKNQQIHDFESTTVGSTPIDFKAENPSAVTVTTDADNNRLLAFGEKGGELILPLDRRGTGINSAVIEFDLVVSGESAVGAKYEIAFNEYLYKERNFASMHLLVTEDGGSKYAVIAEASGEKTGTLYSSTKLSLDTKYRVKFQLFYDEEAVVVSVDGDIIGINGNVLKGCKRFYMGETVIKAISPNTKSTILIDNLVSECIRSDFEVVTAPDIPRKDHGFDSTDGMELSGVTPSGGELSFSGTYGTPYVKIPVNVRVNVPTMSLIGFDITKSDSGSLTLYFTGKSDKDIIAAFDLVKTKDGVDIYEKTQNGRYSAPIYTVTKSSFNLKIEYSTEKQGFNLFVDEKYAVASSLTYTPDSGNHNFEYFRVESSGSSGFAIDNLYAEKICAIFATYTGSSGNLDNTAPTMTYETSSFASMPNKIQLSLGAIKSNLSIREGEIGDRVSKVLEFYSHGEAADIIVFKQTQTSPGSNAAFFETDMMIKSAGGSMNAVFEFRNSSTNTINRFDIDLSEPGAELKVTEATGREFEKTLTDITDNKWFKLRLEYRDTPDDFDYDGNNDIIFRVYVNDKLIGESHSSRIVSPAASVTQLRFTVSKDKEGSVFFDNTTLGQCNMEYEKPIPPDKETLTFTPGVIASNQVAFAFGNKDKSFAEITVEDEVNKILRFHTANGSADTLSIYPTLISDTANAISFETDIKISPTQGTSTFYLEPETGKGKYPFRLTLKATADGNVTISADDIDETNIGNTGEWIHLRVEYMNPKLDYTGDGVADILYKIYIGNSEKPLVGHKVYSSSSYFDPLDLTKYVLTFPSSSEADICLDNVEFWQIELTPDVPDVFPDSGDNYHGDTGTEGGGWTLPK